MTRGGSAVSICHPLERRQGGSSSARGAAGPRGRTRTLLGEVRALRGQFQTASLVVHRGACIEIIYGGRFVCLGRIILRTLRFYYVPVAVPGCGRQRRTPEREAP